MGSPAPEMASPAPEMGSPASEMGSCVADGPPAAIELGDGSGGRVVVQLVGGALDLASLLPRCAAALHHGGAGTCAAALLAGTPQP